MAFFDLTRPERARSLPGLLDIAVKMASVQRQRAALRRLDDAALSDLGLTRAQADAEAQRPFWDVPDTWRA